MRSLVFKLLAFLVISAGSAGTWAATPFQAEAFEAAQAAGKSILIDVSAPWCAVCTAQHPTIAALESREPALLVLSVDFDTSHALLKKFGVHWQSTLIMFKGRTEVGRSTGETDPRAIAELVRRGL